MKRILRSGLTAWPLSYFSLGGNRVFVSNVSEETAGFTFFNLFSKALFHVRPQQCFLFIFLIESSIS